MNRILTFILLAGLGLILIACGPEGSGSTSQNVPGGQMPIPNQELTRVAGAPGAAAPPAQQNQATPPLQVQPTPTRRPADTLPPPASPTLSVVPATQTPPPPTATSSPTFTLPPTEDVVKVALAYLMADGASLRGTLYRPASSDHDLPGVILLPMYVESSQRWEVFARNLARRGFAALALDLRGQGESSGPADWQKSIQDVRQVVRAFADRQEVDGERIAVVGASNAANIALNAATDEPSIRTLVLLSPGLSYRGITTNDALQDLEGRRIYVLASDADTVAGDWPFRMQEMAQDRVILRTYPGDAHGTYLLDAQPGALNVIVRWLNDELVEMKQAEVPAPRRNFTPFLLFCLFASVAGVLLVIAVLLAASLLRRTHIQSRPLAIAELRPGNSRIEVRGKVRRLSEMPGTGVEVSRRLPPAVRLRVEAGEQGGVLETRHDQTLAAPFALVDGSGSLLVVPGDTGVRLKTGGIASPDGSDLEGGVRLDREQARHWLHVFSLDDLATQPDVLYFTLWELAEGAGVGVLGLVSSLPSLLAWEVGINPPSRQPTATSALGAAPRLVLLRGRLVEVFDPLDGHSSRPLALRRLVAEENDPQYGWVILYEEVRAVPFRLEDGYGSAWVELDARRLELDKAPEELSFEAFRQQVGEAAQVDHLSERPCRYMIYELRAGEEIWLYGEAQGEKLLFIADELQLDPVGPSLQPIASVKPETGRVRVSGRILEIALPPGIRPGFAETKTAWLRLRVEQRGASGWQTILDVQRANPFRLEDASGSLWVDPTDAAPDAYGEGLPLTEQQADAVLARLRRDLPAGAGADLRFTVWERHVGEIAEVWGFVTRRPRTDQLPQPVLMLSAPRLGIIDRLHSLLSLLRKRSSARHQ